MENTFNQNNLKQTSFLSSENPSHRRIQNKAVICLLIIITFAVSAVLQAIINLFGSEALIFDSGIPELIIAILCFAVNMLIGKYIYKGLLGAVTFCGLLTLADNVANSVADAIVSPIFIFSNEVSTASHVEAFVSVFLEVISSIAIILLFNKIIEKYEENDEEISETFPERPVAFMIIAYFLSNFAAFIPASILSAVNGIIISNSFDSIMPLQALNNILPIITAICVILQIVIYYFFIKKRYLTKKRTLCLISFLFFSNFVSTPFIRLYNVINYLINSYTALDDLIVNMLFIGNSTLITFVINIICIIITTKKFEPKIREM